MNLTNNILTDYLSNLDFSKRNLVRSYVRNGTSITRFCLYDLTGSPYADYDGDVYTEVYFLTVTGIIYKVFYENKHPYIFNVSTNEKKILHEEWILFRSGYIIQVGNTFKIGFLNYTDKIVEIAPYFHYINTGYSSESTEIALLRKIEFHLSQGNKRQ